MNEGFVDKIEKIIEAAKKLSKWGPVGEELLEKTNFKEASQYRRDFDEFYKLLLDSDEIIEELNKIV